jgi:ABC-type glycerol-3-phosphate transport system permease component
MRAGRAAFYTVTALVVALSLLPFLWLVDTSLKTQIEVTAIPPVLVPSANLDFYRSSIENYNLLHFIRSQ